MKLLLNIGKSAGDDAGAVGVLPVALPTLSPLAALEMSTKK
jgi:hypothetical protein